MNIVVAPVQATTGKKSNAKQQPSKGKSQGFADVLQQYLAGDRLAPISDRMDGFERRRRDPAPQKKIQEIRVKAMQRQVMWVNTEILEYLHTGLT